MASLVSRVRSPFALPEALYRDLTARQIKAVLLLFFALLSLLFFWRPASPVHVSGLHKDDISRSFSGTGGPRVAKVSMLYGASTLYERAVRSHRTHNEQFNYPMRVLREEITGGYWNKPSYLLALVVAELAKPAAERAEWLMWVDADLVLINPAIPLEIFLPPWDFSHVHFVGNKDHAGLNTGTFFLHIHAWSVAALTKAMAFPMYRPDVDLGVSSDQSAMAYVFNESAFAAGVLYQPRVWYNTYEWRHAYEGTRGNLLVHFPGLDDERWPHMDKWLDVVERQPRAWEMPLERTFYPNETSAYWAALREARQTLTEAERLGEDREWQVSEWIREGIERLRAVLTYETDNVGTVRETTKALQLFLDKEAPAVTDGEHRPP